jgi:acyl-CoA thioester hydrolase
MESSAVFHHNIVVRPDHLDDLNHVNNVVYLQWVQDAASAHWCTYASPSVRERYFWVVLRHEIDYRAPAFLNDEITAKTWVQDFDGARSTRMVRLFKKPDILLAEAKTLWCLMKRETGRPMRVTDEIKNLFKESSR